MWVNPLHRSPTGLRLVVNALGCLLQVWFVGCSGQLDSAYQQEAEVVDSTGSVGNTLAVLPVHGNATELGEVATTELQRGLASSKRLILVERARVAEVMRAIAQSHEHDFDPETAVEIGKLLAARYVCLGTAVGSISRTALTNHVQLRATVRLAMRVVRVEDGVILFDEATSGVKDGWANVTTETVLQTSALQRATKELVRRFDNAFLLQGIILEVRDDGMLLIDLGNDRGMTKGMRLDVVRQGRRILHPGTGELVSTPKERMGEIELIQVGETTSFAKVRKGSGMMRGDLVFTKRREKGTWDW